MEAAARVVAREVGKAEAFRHDALPRERRVAVKEDWQDLAAVLVAALGLLRADLAEDDGVDRFQVTGVGDQRHMDADALELPVRRGAEVIFYVARAADILRIGRAAGEFDEDDAIGLARHVGETVEAAAMGHADDELLHDRQSADEG